jgi:alcohol oxidase
MSMISTPAHRTRSGIGSKDLLQQLNIPAVCDLPGVGENYQDHSLGLVPYYAPEKTVTLTTLAMDKEAAAGEFGDICRIKY